jgi:uncharacterized membrane protein YhaH (DUF805 family)
MDWTWYLFGFRGRINRAKYWLAGLILGCWMAFLLFVVVVPVGYFLGSPARYSLGLDNMLVILDPASLRAMPRADIAILVINLVVMPVVLWVWLATSIKRLHDRDKSGWWLVLFVLAPILYGRLADRLPDSHWLQPLAVICLGMALWGWLELCVLRGTKWTNRYGPDPLGKEQMRVRAERSRRRKGAGWDPESEIEQVPRAASPPPVWRVKREA